MFQVDIKSMGQTIEVAKLVANSLKLGDVIILSGTLASGKTYFVKALAATLGCNESVTSPTYTIANFYDLDIGSLLHIDAYRLSSLPEFYDLGLEEFFPDSFTVIEWGEKVAKAFSSYLTIELVILNLEKNHRRMTFSGFGDRWNAPMEMLENNLSDLGHGISE